MRLVKISEWKIIETDNHKWVVYMEFDGEMKFNGHGGKVIVYDTRQEAQEVANDLNDLND